MSAFVFQQRKLRRKKGIFHPLGFLYVEVLAGKCLKTAPNHIKKRTINIVISMWNANSHQYWDNNKIIHLMGIMKMKYTSFTTSKVLGLGINGFS